MPDDAAQGPALPLSGRRVVVPESRELDLFAAMLEAQGAAVLRCPLVKILDLEDAAPVETWLDRLLADRFDDLILLTGEGLRRILAVARRSGRGDAAVAAIGRLRTVTRGPKPLRVLRELGLAPGLTAAEPTTAGVIETLESQPLAGRTVAVQLYPGNPNQPLIDFLRNAGASPDAVLPYRYASDSAAMGVEAVIREMAAGKVDAIAFTSSPQVQRLREIAVERHLEGMLADALRRTKIAAVGPVVAETLAELGAQVSVMPGASFHLKPLVNALCAALGPKP